MKLLSVFKPVVKAAAIVAVFGVWFIAFEFGSLPRRPDGARNVPIDLGKGPIVYGTDREYVSYKITSRVIKGSIVIGFVTMAIGKLVDDRKRRPIGGA